MDSKYSYSTDAPSSSEGKKEVDLLGMLSQHDLNNGSMVDCSLSLGPPGTTPSTLPTSRSAMKPLPTHPSPPPLAPPLQPSLTSQTEVCTMCAATETPLWRRGPYGPKSLCNACGIRYKKEERRLSLCLGFPNSSQTKAHREHRKTNDGFGE